MRRLVVVVVLACLGLPASSGAAQLRELFKKVNASVVEIRTVEKAPAPQPQGGFVQFAGVGSGVLPHPRVVEGVSSSRELPSAACPTR